MANPSLGKFRKFQQGAQALLEDRELPLPDEASMTRGHHFVLFCARVYHSFVRNRCPVRAAALAYTSLLALVPLLAVGVSVSASLLKQQGQQSIQDWIRDGITKVAPMLGLKQAGAGTFPLFSPAEMSDKDFDRVLTRLQGGTGLLSRYVWDQRFSTEGKAILMNTNETVEVRKSKLVDELNNLVTGGPLYDKTRFGGFQPSKRITTLLAKNPQGKDLERLNHWLLAEAYPIGEDPLDSIASQITSFVANFQSGKLGVTAVLALIFVAISLLATIESAFNDIWGVTRGRGWFARVVQYWAALTLGPMFLVSAFTLTTWAKASQRVMEGLPVVHVLTHFLAPLVILSLGCALLYLVMPNTKVPWKAALLGGFVAGGLIQMNSYLNVLYVSRVLTYKQIYGSMATLPLFLLGLYFSWLLVLMGAQVAYAYQNLRAYLQERLAASISQRGREFAALQLMASIGRKFQSGSKPPTGTELAEGLRLPLRFVSQILALLLREGLVHEVTGPECAYAPGRPLHQISMRDVLQALRGQGRESPVSDGAAQAVLLQEFEGVERAWQQAAHRTTLQDLVQQAAKAEESGKAAIPPMDTNGY
jgi:membrane protein